MGYCLCVHKTRKEIILMIKRILAIALTLLMVFALVGCGSNKRVIVEVTLSTEDAEAILAAAGITLPDVSEVAVAGTTVKWFSYYDAFHNYSEDEIVNTGYFTFKEKYGCEIEWQETTWATKFDDLANLILAGTAPDFYPGDANTFPNYALKGMFAPVEDYIDYDDPLWQDTAFLARNYFSLGDSIYMIVTDCQTNDVVAYNRRVVEEWGFDDPAELFYNDEWDWDVFVEMCMDFSDPDENRYALDGWYWDYAIMESGGANVVVYNPETKLFESNVDDPRLEKAADVVYTLMKNDCIFPVWNNGWATRGGNDNHGVGMKEGDLLFYIAGTWAFTDTVEAISSVWGDVEANELMFVPLPKDPNGDGNYYAESKPIGFCLVKGGENHEGVALLADCERFKILDPTVMSVDRKQLMETYKWTEEMLTMYDTCKAMANTEHVLVEYTDGLGAQLSSTSDEYKKFGRTGNTDSSWAQIKEKNQEKLDYYIADLNTQIAEFIGG